MQVGINDAREMNYCSDGIRLFCKRYNLDFKEFVLRGYSSERLLATNDALAINLVKKAEELWEARNNQL